MCSHYRSEKVKKVVKSRKQTHIHLQIYFEEKYKRSMLIILQVDLSIQLHEVKIKKILHSAEQNTKQLPTA